MIITDIQEANTGLGKRKKAYKIYIDDDYAFILYEKELKEYQLSKGSEIAPDLIADIVENTVFPRAKQKSLNMIKHSDKTEKEIYQRLKDECYRDDVIGRTIDYLKSYNYLNDERYASNYIRSRKDTESRTSIEYKLLNKGINKAVLEKIFAEEYEMSTQDADPEILAINKIISRKCEDTTKLSYEEKQKLISLLYKKGFDLDKIHKCL